MGGAGGAALLAERVCSADGRVERLIPSDRMEPGIYTLRFHATEYFARRGAECFYPHCDVVFCVEDGADHQHVPLILSPYGYSTYRGS